MARTAPCPNLPPIPGMCPSIAVMGGGGDGGGGSGNGPGNGDGNANGRGGGQGQNATPDGRNAASGSGSCGGSGGCSGNHGGGSGSASRGDPIDVVTGRVFTVPAIDLRLPGPLPLTILRFYSSGAHDRDVGLGFGWSTSLSWEVEVRRASVRLWKDDGTAVDFPAMGVGDAALGPDGMVLVRGAAELTLDTGQNTWLHFAHAADQRYRLAAIVDRHGNRISLAYQDGRLVEIVDSAGRVVRVASTRDGRIQAFEIKNAPEQGRWVPMAQYAYDDEGDLVSAADAEGAVTTYEYSEHLLTAHTAPTGLTFCFRYDDRRRCVETWGHYPGKEDPSLAASAPSLLADHATKARGIYHCLFDFHDDGYVEVVDSLTVHRYFGNRFGKLDKAVSGGGVHHRTYDENGHLLVYTDPLGATTTWKRDGRGREIEVIDPLGRVTIVNRDPDGHVREVIDPAGGITSVTRLEDGLTWIDPLGAVFAVRTDARGLTRETVAPNGARTVYRHDGQGNLIEKVDALGATTRLTYDPWGRCTSMQDPTGAVTTYAHNTRGDLIAVRHPDGGVTRYAYDGSGNLTSEADPDGRTVSYRYGGLDKLCEVRRPNGDVAQLRYDREGLLVEIRSARGDVHTLERNSFGLVTRERTFDGRELSYEHDLAGNVSAVVGPAGEKTELVRDLASQLIERRYADGASDTFAYDLLGAVVAMTSAAGETYYERNAIGWPTRETQVADGDAVTVERTYDPMGNLVARSTSLGHTAAWRRDARGGSVAVVLDGADAVRVSRDVLGREIARLLPGGGRIDSAYDAMGRLERRRATAPSRAVAVGEGEPAWVGPSGGRITSDRAYRYTSSSELVEAWDQAHGTRRFAYDPAGQLLSSIPEKARAELFRYDPGGDLIDVSAGAEERVYGVGGRLLRRGTTEYGWDLEGRLKEKRVRRDGASDEITRYAWSASGLLRSVEHADGSRVEFDYDPLARRVLKQRYRPGERAPVESTRFVWDGTELVHEVRRTAGDGGGQVSVEERTYCFEEGWSAPWAHRDARGEGSERTASEWFHYLNDDVGTPDRLVGEGGEVACEIERTAWGKGAIKAGSKTRTAIRFPGQYEDAETGLSYNRYRYYDPEVGRYISPDPAGIYAGLDVFAYAENRPTRLADPTGLVPDAVIRDPGRRTDGRRNPNPIEASSGAAPVTDPAIRDAVARARPNAPGVPGGRNCAEHAALHQMASEIRAADPRLRADTPANNAEVQRQLRERFRNGATIQAPGMYPCPLCKEVFRQLGIHPDNINRPGETPATGGVLGPDGAPWDGQTTQTGETMRPRGGGGGGGGRRGRR